MATTLEDLRVLQAAERLADEIWGMVTGWNAFARDTVGGQLVHASDSIGANIAEAFGRFHYGDKVNHLYYARGSLFETKYWLNRCKQRRLIEPEPIQRYAKTLVSIARQINAFASSLKTQRSTYTAQTKAIRETHETYLVEETQPIFDDTDLAWLQSPITNLQSPSGQEQ
ncbi:MAG: four helix bundle protein [Anaerolineales bacterium]|nr:four helix bundle protein [Anaerolineales bacterium]